MSCIIWGPLQNTPPSVGSGLLLTVGGLCGVAYILFYLIAGRGKDVSKWRIAIFFAAFLLLAADGIVQLFGAR